MTSAAAASGSWQPWREAGLAGWVASHEAGHAAACLAFGVPFTHVTIGPAEGASMVHMPAGGLVAEPLAGLMMSWAGLIASMQRWRFGLADSQIRELLSGGDTFTMRRRDGRELHWTVAPWIAPGADFEFASRHFQGRAGPLAVRDAIEIWRDCERFTASLRPAIAAIAWPLRVRGALSYDDVRAIASPVMGGLAESASPGLATIAPLHESFASHPRAIAPWFQVPVYCGRRPQYR